jgi:hypothetical protein
MNNCTFLGTIESLDHQVVDNVDKVVLVINVENRRKKSGKKDVIEKESLDFEAWDSAAMTLFNHTENGDLILIEDSTARSNKPFRINKFRILQYVDDVDPEN